MLLWMVVAPEPASFRMLLLRMALLNSWPLITPDMLPRLPRSSPGRRWRTGTLSEEARTGTCFREEQRRLSTCK